jgi:hypothetical protein
MHPPASGCVDHAAGCGKGPFRDEAIQKQARQSVLKGARWGVGKRLA